MTVERNTWTYLELLYYFEIWEKYIDVVINKMRVPFFPILSCPRVKQ